jgi:hypothetical protein
MIVSFGLYFLDCVSYYSCDIIVMLGNMISSMQRGITIYKEKKVLMLYDHEMLCSEWKSHITQKDGAKS